MLTLTCAVLVALRLAKQLTKPIATLISGIEIVAAGNMDYHVPQVSNDELSRLSTIFNYMTVKLKKLQEEMKKAERLSTIGQMANILGHEIRNPLAAITNAVYLIKWQVSKLPDVNPKVFKNIGVIEAEIKSTEKIINDMLDFSRQRPPVLSKQDLGEVVKSIMADAKVPENVKLTMDFAELPAVAIDIEEMKQVIRNLINNAIDSMVESPQRELILQTTPAALTKGTATVKAVKLDIIDTGCGIPPDTLARIWEPFFSTKSKGTGLGLAVVKRIVQERHYNAVEVHSSCNKGTTFTVTLPII
jgi:nitrogen fixation/metabolism regulation signal transduction histidine kinase